MSTETPENWRPGLPDVPEIPQAPRPLDVSKPRERWSLFWGCGHPDDLPAEVGTLWAVRHEPARPAQLARRGFVPGVLPLPDGLASRHELHRYLVGVASSGLGLERDRELTYGHGDALSIVMARIRAVPAFVPNPDVEYVHLPGATDA